MKLVNWTENERVDLSEKLVEAAYYLGEFRRTMRAVVLGDRRNAILRGFKVEAQAVPDATVKVDIDLGSSEYSAAFMSENNGSSVEYGQLAGDTNPEGIEGNASYNVDFTGQPADTYYVEVRFVYSEGENDNRAFWNESTNTEYVTGTNTRLLPTLSFHLVTVAAGGEWMPLATVVWNGATVSPGDITDVRELAFEGASPWGQTTQQGTGGMPDFDRSDARPDVTNDAIYNVLLKIGRQIQDMKGPTKAGVFNFHGRPVSPLDPSNTLNAAITKSIATLDTTEFVVGDGVTQWGDFNGSTGLQTCLEHIRSNASVLPQRVRIRLKTSSAGAGTTPIWTCANQVLFGSDTLHLEIVGDLGEANANDSRVPISVTFGGATGWLNFSPAGSYSTVTFRNIAVTNVATCPFVQGNARGVALNLDNCFMVSSATHAFDVYANGIAWRNTQIGGQVYFRSGFDNSTIITKASRFEGCIFKTVTGIGTVPTGFRSYQEDDPIDEPTGEFLKNAIFEGCLFDAVGYTDSGTYTRRPIDLESAKRIAFRDCYFKASADRDLITMGALGSDNSQGTQNVEFDNCVFEAEQAVFGVNHEVNAGLNGSSGTGWFIYHKHSVSAPNATTLSGYTKNITFRSCRTVSLPTTDAGFARFDKGFRNITFEECTFEGGGFVAAGYVSRRKIHVLSFNDSTTLIPGKRAFGVKVKGCTFHNVSSGGAGATCPNLIYLYLFSVDDVRVEGNTFRVCDTSGDTDPDFFTSTALIAAVWFYGCKGLKIIGNEFYDFVASSNAATGAISVRRNATRNNSVHVKANTFADCAIGLIGDSVAQDIELVVGENIWAGAAGSLINVNTDVNSIVTIHDNQGYGSVTVGSGELGSLIGNNMGGNGFGGVWSMTGTFSEACGFNGSTGVYDSALNNFFFIFA